MNPAHTDGWRLLRLLPALELARSRPTVQLVAMALGPVSKSILVARIAATALLSSTLAAAASAQQERGHVVGVGGVFVRSADPARLAAWYHDVLGIKLESWGGALLRYDAPDHPPVAVWNAFRPDDRELKPSTRDFVINFAVDDLDAMLAKLRNKKVSVIERQQDENGRFASILDPDGTKIELWEPKRPQPSPAAAAR